MYFTFVSVVICDDIFSDVSGIIGTTPVNFSCIFNINKILFNLAYGVNLVESDSSVIDVQITNPSFDFNTLIEENIRLTKKIEELEIKLANSSMKNGQISLFDQDD